VSKKKKRGGGGGGGSEIRQVYSFQTGTLMPPVAHRQHTTCVVESAYMSSASHNKITGIINVYGQGNKKERMSRCTVYKIKTHNWKTFGYYTLHFVLLSNVVCYSEGRA